MPVILLCIHHKTITAEDNNILPCNSRIMVSKSSSTLPETFNRHGGCTSKSLSTC
ncbi:hypothetical protein OIU74_000339 [Salix koriyanagi]|uniref:Uncharacterized protein n=1 Tax=Salix koriyanagi TaxID=2511006 RepID=A0A9Q0WYY0_9ROSI|nr:hypothetical protein OIU74_000339 [Salix koriyanagi]